MVVALGAAGWVGGKVDSVPAYHTGHRGFDSPSKWQHSPRYDKSAFHTMHFAARGPFQSVFA